MGASLRQIGDDASGVQLLDNRVKVEVNDVEPFVLHNSLFALGGLADPDVIGVNIDQVLGVGEQDDFVRQRRALDGGDAGRGRVKAVRDGATSADDLIEKAKLPLLGSPGRHQPAQLAVIILVGQLAQRVVEEVQAHLSALSVVNMASV